MLDKYMVVSNRKSFLWNMWKIFFPGADMNRVFITWGRGVYMPASYTELPPDLAVHEAVHVKQQKNWLGGLFWWIKAITDRKFLYRQELEAYRAQYEWFCNTKMPNYKQKFEYRRELAKILSSETYGNIVTETEAFEALGKKED